MELDFGKPYYVFILIELTCASLMGPLHSSFVFVLFFFLIILFFLPWYCFTIREFVNFREELVEKGFYIPIFLN